MAVAAARVSAAPCSWALGANVTVSNVSLLNNVAQGGNGGAAASAHRWGRRWRRRIGRCRRLRREAGGGGGGGVGNPAGWLGGPFFETTAWRTVTLRVKEAAESGA